MDGMDPNMGGPMNGMDPNMGGPMDGMNPNMGGPMDGMDPNMGGPMDGMDPNMGGPMDGMNLGMDGQFDGMNPGMDGQFDGMNPGMDGQFDGMNPGMDGQFDGMNPGMDGQFDGMNPGMDGQFGGMNPGMDGQFGEMNPGMDGQFGEMNPGMDGQFGEMNPGMDGQFGGMNPGMDGQFGEGNPGMDGQFGDGSQTNYNNTQEMGGDDMAFVERWMGSLYEKAHSSKFNWCAAFFTGGYLLYRKMYTTGIITMILQLAITTISAILIPKSPVLSTVIYLVLSIGLFVGLGLGFYPLYRKFVKGKLQALKGQISDQNQLMTIAEQKGGTSVIGVVGYYVGYSILSGIVFSTLAASALSSLFGGIAEQPTNENTNVVNETVNQVQEQPVQSKEKFYFYEDYYLSYDKEWFFDSSNKKLTKGSYEFIFYEAYPKERTQMDLSTQEGRKALLDYLKSALTQMASQANWKVDGGNDNFVPQESIYYNYIDFISAETIQRMYFAVIPEESLLFEFILTINDTNIDTETNTLIIEMLSSIKKDSNSGESAFGGTNGDANQVNNGNITTEEADSNNVSSETQVDANATQPDVTQTDANATQPENAGQTTVEPNGNSTTISTQPSLTQTIQ